MNKTGSTINRRVVYEQGEWQEQEEPRCNLPKLVAGRLTIDSPFWSDSHSLTVKVVIPCWHWTQKAHFSQRKTSPFSHFYYSNQYLNINWTVTVS